MAGAPLGAARRIAARMPQVALLFGAPPVEARRIAARMPRVALLFGALLGPLLGPLPAGAQDLAALYPRDGRRDLTGADIDRYPGAGVLFCHGPDGIPRKAAAAWLIGDPSVVVLNAHNFRNRRLETTREVADCFFQIGGRNYDFVPDSILLGAVPGTQALHITDDWAILRLVRPVEGVRPQPMPAAPELGEGPMRLPIVMVSPGGHENYRGPASLEACAIRQVDPPSEGGIRRLRHDCNDGFGGSGSGLFDEAGRLVAMQSASLSMNARKPFDIEFHYGSALAFEGDLLAALRKAVAGQGAP